MTPRVVSRADGAVDSGACECRSRTPLANASIRECRVSRRAAITIRTRRECTKVRECRMYEDTRVHLEVVMLLLRSAREISGAKERATAPRRKSRVNAEEWMHLLL